MMTYEGVALPLEAGTHSLYPPMETGATRRGTWPKPGRHGERSIDVIVTRQTASLQVVQQSFSVKEDTSLIL